MCQGGVDDDQIPICQIQIPSGSTQSIQENSPCVEEISDVITSLHDSELHSTYSKELKVTGLDSRVTGTYYMSEIVESDRPVYIKEGNTRYSTTDSFFIFYASDAQMLSGWRIGNERSMSGVSSGSYTYCSGKHGINPGDTGVEWTFYDGAHYATGKTVQVQRSEKGQLKKTTNCPKAKDIDHDQAEQDIKLDTVVKRKRKLIQNENFEDRPWINQNLFKDEWLDMISTNQSNLIPIEEVQKARNWFEYLGLTYRCWLCHQYSDIFDIRPQHRSQLASDEGVLYKTWSRNKEIIRYHAETIGHDKIVTRLMQIYDGSDLYDDLRWTGEKPKNVVTARVMRTVYTAVKHLSASYNSMKYLITLQEQHGLKVTELSYFAPVISGLLTFLITIEYKIRAILSMHTLKTKF